MNEAHMVGSAISGDLMTLNAFHDIFPSYSRSASLILFFFELASLSMWLLFRLPFFYSLCLSMMACDFFVGTFVNPCFLDVQTERPNVDVAGRSFNYWLGLSYRGHERSCLFTRIILCFLELSSGGSLMVSESPDPSGFSLNRIRQEKWLSQVARVCRFRR